MTLYKQHSLTHEWFFTLTAIHGSVHGLRLQAFTCQ